MTDYQGFLSDCIRWAKEVGKVQLGFFRGDHLDIRTKYNESDIVTAADKASESILIGRILEKYPDHSILSEESGEAGRTSGCEFQWVIDPLDGTTNFSSGLPYFNVSIGLRHNGVTVAGVVFAPYIGEMFHAVRNGGAFLNGNRIHTPVGRNDIHKAVVATGFPVDKDRTNDNNLDNVARVLPLVRGLRRLGSAALDISYVAAGFLDAYWELNLHEWDVCAALLIAEEAGAPYDFFRDDRNISVLVANPGIMGAISPLIARKKP